MKDIFFNVFFCGWISGSLIIWLVYTIYILDILDFTTAGQRFLLSLIINVCGYVLSYRITLKYFKD